MDVPIARGSGWETWSKRRWKGQVSTFLLCCILYWRQEYPSFYCTLIYYSETGDKARQSVSLWVSMQPADTQSQTHCQNLLKLCCCWAASSSTQPPTQSYVLLYWNIDSFFKKTFSFHLHAYLCPCCVMSMALLAGTGEPPSVTLRTSMDFLSGLLLPWRFNMGESTRFLGGSVAKKTKAGQMDSACAWWLCVLMRVFLTHREVLAVRACLHVWGMFSADRIDILTNSE